MKYVAVAIGLAALLTHPSARADDSPPPCADGAPRVTRDSDASSGCERAGKRVGVWEWRNSARQVVYRISYDERGVENGPAWAYSDEGRLVRESRFVDGKVDGIETRWFPESGHLREQSAYSAGRLHGMRKRWVYTPKLASTCTPEQEKCWSGSQECWIEGERRPHEACDRLYASFAARRTPAGSKER